MSMRLTCPHCGCKAVIRTSRKQSELSIEQGIQCSNIECGHTWVAITSAVRTIVPSRCPNPRVFIQLSPRSPHAASPPGQMALAGIDTG